MKGKRILASLCKATLFSSLMLSCNIEKNISYDITKDDKDNKLGDVIL